MDRRDGGGLGVIRVPDLVLPLDHDEGELARAVADRLRLPPSDVASIEIRRRSVDARRKGDIRLVYTVDAAVGDEAAALARVPPRLAAPAPVEAWAWPRPGSEPLLHPPVVIGTGPAGLFAALLLARLGYRPVVLERGRPVEERVADVERFHREGVLDPASNVQFGEGGAGTFSDGKLYTLIRDGRVRRVFEDLVAAGAPREILWHHKPHIGTDRLRGVVSAIRGEILSAGGEVRFSSRVGDIVVSGARVAGVTVDGGGQIEARAVVLAVGHSARDTFAMLRQRDVRLSAKPFSLGTRIEHPQELVDRSQYGNQAGHPRLGAAEYKLAWHGPAARSAYTFCVCPGGEVVAAASEEGGVVTNGMSRYARDGRNCNSALLVNVGPADFGEEDPLAGVEFQRRWERAAFAAGGGGYRAPAQLVGDFLRGRASAGPGGVTATYRPGVAWGDLAACLPPFVVDTLRRAIPALDRKMHGFALPEAVLTGVETRSSSPLRVERDGGGESSLPGLYPAGEGAGHAGGIVSAAVDGLKAAEAIVRRFRRP